MVGRATVVKPLSSVEIAVMRVTQVMMIAVLDFEVTVTVRSRLCKGSSSIFPSKPAILDGLPEACELLGRLNEEVPLAVASGGCIDVSSI